MYNDVHARYRVEISLFLITNPLLHLFHIWNVGPQDVYCDLNIQADARPPSNMARMGMIQGGLVCSNICLSTLPVNF